MFFFIFKVLCTAHTGIAAALLPNGTTVHRTFELPLENSDFMSSRIENGSAEGI